MISTEKRWSKEKGKQEAAKLLCNAIDKYAKDQAPRREMAKRRLGVYLGLPADVSPQLETSTYYRPLAIDKSYPLRFAQSVVDTAKAKIAARQRPKGQVLTKGGSYKHRLQAKQLSKFCEGILYQQQGCYETSWELGNQVFKDAEIWEAGIIKVWPDYETGQLCHERGFAYEYYVDPLEAKRGAPRHLHNRYAVSKFSLAEQYSELEDAIMMASLATDDGDIDSNADMCSVYEGWFLGRGKTKGRHIAAVRSSGSSGGTDVVTVLIDEEWTWPCFPIATVVWERDQFGIWGTPLVDQIAETQAYANDVFLRIAANVRTLAKGHLDVERGTYDDNTMKLAGEFKIMERLQGRPPAQVTMPPAFNQTTFQFFQETRSMCFENPGVSELGAQGKKQPGIDSGVAIRETNDLQSERFLPKSQAQENLFVQLARLDMYAARDMRAKDVTVKASHGYGEYLDEIIWDDIEPEDDELFTVQASSSAVDTLAGRRQFVADYAAAGYITPDVAERMLATPNPDIEAMSKREQAQYRYLERVIARFQNADEDTWDPNVDGVVPDELLAKEAAYLQMVDGYIEMLGDEAPEFNLGLIREYIALLNDMMQPPVPPVEEMPMPPGGPGGGMPMMDAGMPMDPAMGPPPGAPMMPEMPPVAA